MKSLYDFIVEPLGETYSNEVQVENKSLILNTKIESFKFVNRHAIVKSCPLAYYTGINVGDTIIVHQNVFRVFYDTMGKQKKVDLGLKITYIFVNQIKFIYINKMESGKVLMIDVL